MKITAFQDAKYALLMGARTLHLSKGWYNLVTQDTLQNRTTILSREWLLLRSKFGGKELLSLCDPPDWGILSGVRLGPQFYKMSLQNYISSRFLSIHTKH